METLETLKRRTDTAETLRDLVRTMKTLAAVSVRRYERVVSALADYGTTVELGLRALLHHAALPPSPPQRHDAGRTGVVVFGSDQGLCGTFNEQVIGRLLADVRDGRPHRERLRLYAVGTRAGARLSEVGLAAEGEATLPVSTALLPSLVQELLLVIDGWRAEGDLAGVLLYHNRPLSGTLTQPHRATLLPLSPERLQRLSAEPWPTHALPLYTMDRPELLSLLTREYLFVRLHQALALSLAAEHTSRLVAMQAAEHNIDDRLEDLQSRYHTQRQTTITTELLDIVAGAEALADAAA